MSIIQDTSKLENKAMSTLLIQTLVTVFTFLTALSIRDSMSQTIEEISPESSKKKIFFTTFTALTFLFLTVLIVYFWQDSI